MDEEFFESDVIFSDYQTPNTNYYSNSTRFQSKNSNQRRKPKNKMTIQGSRSVPVNIPASILQYGDEIDDRRFDFEFDCEFDDEIVPPHVIVARRILNDGGKIACSFCVDVNGRILKGRNLCEVRNSILRMTGFLET